MVNRVFSVLPAWEQLPAWLRSGSDALPSFSGLSLARRLPFQLQTSQPMAIASQVLDALNRQLMGKPLAVDWATRVPWASDASTSSGPMSVGGGAGGPDRPGAPGQRPPALVANQIMVQWSPTSTATERLEALRAIGGTVMGTIHSGLMQQRGQGMVEVIALPPGLSVEQALQAYTNRPGVELAEVDWAVGVQRESNDPYYTTNARLWGMYSSDSPTAAGGSGTTNAFGSQAEQAWAKGYTGSSKVVVGVIDEGIDYTHPDLYLNIWLNQREIRGLSFFESLVDINKDNLITFHDLNDASNAAFVSDINLNGRIDAGDLLRDSRWADGKDNDGNGYRDDLIGWDFVYNTNDPFRPSEGDNHGTHVAGTIGGIGDNATGVAGVNWDVQMMALKFLGPSGGYTSGAAAAVNYYANMTALEGGNAQYIGTSNSWGGGGYSSTLYNAIVNGGSVGNLFVAAAGNSAVNNDTTNNYPSNYSTRAALGWDAVVAVASITSSGAMSSFSSYGSTTVDLGAPGSSINSTVAGGGYASYSGTSMATPHVSGALALLASAFPQATPQQLLKALYDGTAATTSLAGKTVTGGRLDVNRSLQLLNATLGDGGSGGTEEPTPPPPQDPSMLLWGTTGNDVITGGNNNDQLAGVPSSGTTATALGRGQIDTLTGRAGADLFLLGDRRGTFYNDGNNRNQGTGDYALIKDFNIAEGDRLQLRAGTQILYRNVTLNGIATTEIFLGNGDSSFSAADELIGRLENTALAPGAGVWVLGNQSWTSYV